MKALKSMSYIPLFFVVLFIYHIMALVGVDFGSNIFDKPWILPSEAEWTLKWSDLLIMLGVITLYIEVLKSTRTGSGTIIEHALSLLVFLVFLMDFLFFNHANATSAFLVITLMSLLDVIAGFAITIASARRDLTMGGA
jgi:hypothetical protein